VACLLRAVKFKSGNTSVARQYPYKRQVRFGCRGDRSNTAMEEVWGEVHFMQFAVMATSHYNKATARKGVFCAVRAEARKPSSSAKIKLTLHKALIRSVMTYACPAREMAGDVCLLELQRLQNRVLRTTGNFPRCTSVHDLHTAFSLPYVYDYITKLCRKQAEVIQSHESEHVRSRGRVEARHRKYKRLKLGGGQAYDRSSN
jgi:hypothetical protein